MTVEIKVTCDKCETKFEVHHLEWTHVSCLECGYAIPNETHINDEDSSS
jgi:predicted nucleic-acid-binding Zn-ribbon protein